MVCLPLKPEVDLLTLATILTSFDVIIWSKCNFLRDQCSSFNKLWSRPKNRPVAQFKVSNTARRQFWVFKGHIKVTWKSNMQYF